MSRLNTILSVQVEDQNDETGMCHIGCMSETYLCERCHWGNPKSGVDVCDAATDSGLCAPQDVYDQITRLCT